MITTEEIQRVAKERGLPYSKAKMLVEMWEREAKENGQADFIRGYDDGESQTTVDQNYYDGKK